MVFKTYNLIIIYTKFNFIAFTQDTRKGTQPSLNEIKIHDFNNCNINKAFNQNRSNQILRPVQNF